MQQNDVINCSYFLHLNKTQQRSWSTKNKLKQTIILCNRKLPLSTEKQ